MAIKKNNYDITNVYWGGYKILSIYINGYLIWPKEENNPKEEILSCFYNGYWIDEYPWTDDTSWID